jgi:hypothetical protein
MLAAGAIGGTGISADAGTVAGAGGIVIDEDVVEAVLCGELRFATVAATLFLTESSELAVLGAPPGLDFDEGVVGSVGVAATFVPEGTWAPALAGSADWMAVAADQDGWIVIAVSGDLWIRQ